MHKSGFLCVYKKNNSHYVPHLFFNSLFVLKWLVLLSTMKGFECRTRIHEDIIDDDNNQRSVKGRKPSNLVVTARLS